MPSQPPDRDVSPGNVGTWINPGSRLVTGAARRGAEEGGRDSKEPDERKPS